MPNPQLGDSEKQTYTIMELDAASQPASLKPGDVVTVTSDSPNSASIVPDPTPVAGSVASGFVVGGTPKVGIVLTATVTHADGSPGLTATDTIDVVGGVASSLAFGLGAPVAK